MKNIFTPLASLLFFLCSTFVAAQQVNLTLNVDMTYQSVSELGVHVAGSFQGWNPSSTQLTDDDGDNIYSVTISVDANSFHEYKFINGNYWGADEQVYGGCAAANGNRRIEIMQGESNLSENAFYFGSCDFAIPAVTGCTDGSACNYFSDATEDDGSCQYAAEGFDCDGNEVCNYASVDYVGLTGSNESNGIYYLDFESYSPVGTSTDGYTAHIVVNGESSPIDYNYVVGNNNAWYAAIPVTPGSVYTWSATIETCGGGQTINGEYASPIYGCTGSDHCNYNPEATMDDGSCIYAAEGFDCAGNCLSGTLVTVDGGVYLGEKSWDIADCDGNVLASGGAPFAAPFAGCVELGDNYALNLQDSYGDGWDGTLMTINGDSYTVESGASANFIVGSCGVAGCTDAAACNYNAEATFDDGSCDVPAAGLDCEGNCLSGDLLTMNDSYGDGWDGAVLTINGVDYTIEGFSSSATACVDLLDCNTVSWTAGSYDSETSWSLGDVASGSDGSGAGAFGAGCVPGCMDAAACNYNDAADVDDGSCEFGAPIDYFGLTNSNESDGVYYLDFESYSHWGTSTDGYSTTIVVNGDSSVLNYNYVVGNNNSWYAAIPVTPGSVYTWSATIETCGGSQSLEGEYLSPLFGCMDQNALNYNDSATNDDGSCNYPVCQSLDLLEGWSLFSTYIVPQVDSLNELLSPIVENIEIVKDFQGTAYIPDYNFNGIGTLSIGQGYQSKLYAPSSIDVCGEYASPELNPISLTQGWNMIGYLRLDPASADLVLEEIANDGNLVIAKDYLGLAYLPEWGFNAMGDMKATQGYQIKVSEDDILLYLSNESSYRMSAIEVTNNNNVTYFTKSHVTDNNMTVIIEDAAWDVVPNEGAEIAAFDKFGNIVGSAIYSSPVSVLTVWGNDATTSSKDGMLVSELLSFKIWNNNEVQDFKVSNWIEGFEYYQVNGISVASSIETTNMIFENNTSERVLVKVINVLGQEVNLDDQTFKGTVLFNVFDDGTVEQIIR